MPTKFFIEIRYMVLISPSSEDLTEVLFMWYTL